MTNSVPNLPTLHDFGTRVIRLPLPQRDAAEARHLRRRLRILAYIDAHLSDPELSARIAARALGMSVRSLHLALAPAGESFNLLVQRRRLDACLALLRRPDRGETIAAIAFACGFNSLSSFYRAFRRSYQTNPRALSSDTEFLAA